jgi:hypothetical protein
MNAATFDTIGERLTKALITGDFDLYQQVMGLPITIEPRGGDAYTLTDTQGLHEDFRLYHQSISARRITDIYRKVESIEKVGGNRFDVTCLMHILAGTQRAVEPFHSTMGLSETPEGWRFCHIYGPLRHIQWTLGEIDL